MLIGNLPKPRARLHRRQRRRSIRSSPSITGGAVTGINQIARLQTWLTEQGCPAKKLDRKAIEKLLHDAELMPAPVQRVLELRLGGAQAAVKKIDALLARAGDDDRVRGAFRYHGASTGRWAGEGFQPQNLKRPAVDDLDCGDRRGCDRRL